MRWNHYKGGVYEHITYARDHSGQIVVVYRSEDGQVWTRPFGEFVESVMVGDKFRPRFIPFLCPEGES